MAKMDETFMEYKARYEKAYKELDKKLNIDEITNADKTAIKNFFRYKWKKYCDTCKKFKGKNKGIFDDMEILLCDIENFQPLKKISIMEKDTFYNMLASKKYNLSMYEFSTFFYERLAFKILGKFYSKNEWLTFYDKILEYDKNVKINSDEIVRIDKEKLDDPKYMALIFHYFSTFLAKMDAYFFNVQDNDNNSKIFEIRKAMIEDLHILQKEYKLRKEKNELITLFIILVQAEQIIFDYYTTNKNLSHSCNLRKSDDCKLYNLYAINGYIKELEFFIKKYNEKYCELIDLKHLFFC